MNNLETPVSAETHGAETPEISAKVESIAKIVSESARENSKTSRGTKVAKPKRAGGRPRKDGAPNKATLKLMGLDSDPLAATPPQGSETGPVDTSAPPADTAPDSGLQALEIPTVMLRPALNLPFSVLRAKTGFDGFKLPDEVANECLPLLEHVLKQYLPATNSPHAPAMTLVGTLGMVLAVQFSEFRAWKKENEKPSKTPEKNPAKNHFAGFPVEHVK